MSEFRAFYDSLSWERNLRSLLRNRHNSKSCTSTPKCSNCKAEHPSYSRKCPRWVEEKEIQTIKVTQNTSFAEARKIVTSRTPTVGISYSSMASICPHCKNRTTAQVEAPPDNNLIPLPKNSPVKENRENTKTEIILDRSSLPNASNVNNQEANKTNQNYTLKTQSIIQSNGTKTVNNISHSKLSRIPQSNKTETPKKVVKSFKETKAMRKSRMQIMKKNLDVKIKDSIQKRTLTKQDFLKEPRINEGDDDTGDLKIHPSDDDVMFTDGEEETSKTPNKK
ncbi:hypothetical protein AVEN_91660-1 [Araneus ventricosus]|uniref:Uncharacterized protein n=1 Tax=Araneus ventricosus TaxID=182803 RepID=A0A4Y2IRR4_ARAVE|nr:hypothetical protein AVEN_91660-1 [Araneus ventricosus]